VKKTRTRRARKSTRGTPTVGENESNESSDDIELTSGVGQIIPGNALERAIATSTTVAVRSFLRGIGTILGAAFAETIARKHAKASAIKSEIHTAAEIAKSRALADARRRTELEEIEHATNVARRRADRMMHEMIAEQNNLEAISLRSLKMIEESPSREPKDVQADWLRQFAENAQRISERDVQELWARILTSNVSRDQNSSDQQTSLAALDRLRLLDKRSALVFKHCWRYWAAFGFIFPAFVATEDVPDFHYGTDTSYLSEIGLLSPREFSWVSDFGWLQLQIESATPGRSQIKRPLRTYLLTSVGEEIARTVFGRRTVLKEAALISADMPLAALFNTRRDGAMPADRRYEALVQYIMILAIDILGPHDWKITLSDSHKCRIDMTFPGQRRWGPFAADFQCLPTEFVPELNHFNTFKSDFARLFERYKSYRFAKLQIPDELKRLYMDSVYTTESDSLIPDDLAVSI
jgi:Protein of unknown function (DUF2806)